MTGLRMGEVAAAARSRWNGVTAVMDEWDARLHRIGQDPFRAKFRLRAGTAQWSTCAASPLADMPRS